MAQAPVKTIPKRRFDLDCRRCRRTPFDSEIRFVEYMGAPPWRVCNACVFELAQNRKSMIVWDRNFLPSHDIVIDHMLPPCRTCGRYEQVPGHEECEDCLGIKPLWVRWHASIAARRLDGNAIVRAASPM